MWVKRTDCSVGMEVGRTISLNDWGEEGTTRARVASGNVSYSYTFACICWGIVWVRSFWTMVHIGWCRAAFQRLSLGLRGRIFIFVRSRFREKKCFDGTTFAAQHLSYEDSYTVYRKLYGNAGAGRSLNPVTWPCSPGASFDKPNSFINLHTSQNITEPSNCSF